MQQRAIFILIYHKIWHRKWKHPPPRHHGPMTDLFHSVHRQMLWAWLGSLFASSGTLLCPRALSPWSWRNCSLCWAGGPSMQRIPWLLQGLRLAPPTLSHTNHPVCLKTQVSCAPGVKLRKTSTDKPFYSLYWNNHQNQIIFLVFLFLLGSWGSEDNTWMASSVLGWWRLKGLSFFRDERKVWASVTGVLGWCSCSLLGNEVGWVFIRRWILFRSFLSCQ